MINLQELEVLTHEVSLLCREVAGFQKKEQANLKSADIQSKGLHNFVTWVDKESENRIVHALGKLLPGSGFIAEETPELLPAEYTWVVDPLDGTTNFIHGVPLFSISIGLVHREEIILGVILEPNLDECFYTWKDAPSFLNGKEIRVSDRETLNDSLFATGFPYYDYSRLEEYLAIFRYLLQHSHGLRRLGSAAADLAYVAAGRYDGFYEYGLNPWDVCAGSILVKNAGGVVTDFAGGNSFLFGKQILATNNKVYPEFFQLFRNWTGRL